MSTEIKVNGEVVTAYLKGELDHHSAREMRERIDEAIEMYMPSLLVMNFGEISFMDSSGIGLVLGRYRNLAKTGAKLHIAGAAPNIYKVMKLAGIERLATIDKN